MTYLFENCKILTMTSADSASAIIEGSVAIVGGRIELVSADKRRVAAFVAAQDDVKRIDCADKLMMPGLINTHTHVSMTLQRSFADDYPLMEWLNDRVWPFEAQQTAEDIEVGARLGIAEMLLSGTTTFVDMYSDEDYVARAVKDMGIRAVLGEGVLDRSIGQYRQRIERVMKAAEGCDRIQVSVSPHAPYTCSPKSIEICRALAEEFDLPTMTHVSETKAEVETIRDNYGQTSAEYLDSLGMLSSRLIAAHCIYMTDSDIELFAKNGVSVAYNPNSNMKLSSGVAPIAKMMRMGVNCTFATDGACSNNNLDLWGDIRTGTYLQKLDTGDPTVLSAYEALQMATVNAAKAIGYEGSLGVIAEGAIADLLLINTEKAHFYPRHDMVANLVYCANGSDVDTVVVDGKMLVEGGKLLDVDLPQLFAQSELSAKRILSKLEDSAK